MRARLVSVIILLVLIVSTAGGTLVNGGCAAPEVPAKEVSEMKALEIPAIDLAQPASFATATFALG
jgi:hypothetical protein